MVPSASRLARPLEVDLEEEGTGDPSNTGGNTATRTYAPAACSSSNVLPGSNVLPAPHDPATRPPCPRGEAMTRDLVVEWRGRRFVVEPNPGGVAVTEEGTGQQATLLVWVAVVELALSQLLTERLRAGVSPGVKQSRR